MYNQIRRVQKTRSFVMLVLLLRYKNTKKKLHTHHVLRGKMEIFLPFFCNSDLDEYTIFVCEIKGEKIQR